MSVSSIPAVSRVEPAASSARPSDTPQRPQSEQSSPAVGHKFLEEPEPRRFPWLSWETRELQVASKQPSPYGNIPLLGKELDRQV